LLKRVANIRARAANILAIDDCDELAFAGKGSSRKCRSRAAGQDYDVKFFRLRLLKYLNGRGAFGPLQATFPFRATGSLLACIDFMRAADDAPSSDSP
jgi:hypothetical protein